MQTLVLNQSYMPISRVSWQKAITWVVTGRAEIIEEYDGMEIRSARDIFPMPSVVRFFHKISQKMFKRGVKFNRKNVWLRDKGKCFQAGTRILMSDGSQRDISKIQPGNRVIDAFGWPQEVLAVGSRKAPVVSLLHRGSAIETMVTPDHPFLTQSGKWVPIQDVPTYLMFPRSINYDVPKIYDFDAAEFLSRDRWMRVKDGRVYTSRRPHEVGVPTRLEVSPEHAYILGLFAAEGNCTGGQRVIFSFHEKEQNTLATDVVRFYTRLGFHPTLSIDSDHKGCSVRICSKGLAEILLHFCGKKENKKTPWLLLGPYHREYLRGLFSGDASFSPGLGKTSLYLIADDLIFQAQSMLWGLGIFPTVQVIRRPRRKPAWGLVLNARNYSEFMNLVMETPTPDGTMIYGDVDFVYRKVKSVEQKGSAEVFNLEVGGTHSYIANGLAVHNCQYCGDKVSLSSFTYDHVVPSKNGGKTRWDNIVVACYGCNQKKGHKTLRECGMTLRMKPAKPKNLPGMVFPVQVGEAMPETWKDYLSSYSYWNQDITES